MESFNAADSGSWLRPLLDPAARDMHCVVPHGFSAYARVLHPVSRDRPADTLSWHRQDKEVLVDVDSESVPWSEVARTFGASMHALAQYHRLSGPAAGPYGEVLDAAGWRYSEPRQGNLDIHVLAAAASILSRHTTTPVNGVAAIWEGWGGLTSSAGYSQLSFGMDGGGGRGTVTLGAEDGAGSGLLPASVVRGPRLELPGRSHFLFSSSPAEFTDPAWALNAPWHHDPRWPQSPSLLWPEDRAWVMVTEIDFDSTIIAGNPALVAGLVSSPEIEAFEIPEGADLSWDAC
ncbi:hypothetical protein [Arthrobacter sp. UYCu723]